MAQGFSMKELTMDPPGEWKICIPDPFLNCEKIYPIQQKKVKEFLSAACERNDIRKIIVFGSSTSNRCHCGSDVDFYVETDKKVKLNLPALTFVCDIWTNHTVDERLYKEIMKKGVVVYDKDIIHESA